MPLRPQCWLGGSAPLTALIWNAFETERWASSQTGGDTSVRIELAEAPRWAYLIFRVNFNKCSVSATLTLIGRQA